MAEVPTPHLQLQYIRAALSGIMAPPKGQKITKLGFWNDSSGNLKYVKAYEGEEELFVLTFSNAGAASEETWNMERTES